MTTPLEALHYHVSGAIERGEKTAIEAHEVGQVWYPLKDDQRWKISLTWSGYSAPMYCCWFCDELKASCRDLGKAEHACQVLAAEREASL